MVDRNRYRIGRSWRKTVWIFGKNCILRQNRRITRRTSPPFIYAHHVVCALEAENGEVYTGFCIESCSGVMNLCAERVAALHMYVTSGQTKIQRLIAFRDKPPYGEGSGMPCGACREFLYQLNEANENMEILVDYETRETVTLRELMPKWWGKERYSEAK